MRAPVVVIVLAAFSGSAGAAPESGKSADGLIDRGVNLRRQGKPAEALELFERANGLASSARAIAQMGLAEMSLHRWIDADTHIEAALARHDSDWIGNPKTREALQKALADVARHLGRVRVEGTDGAELTIDGRLVGRLPLSAPVPVNPGTVRIRATAQGHLPADVDIVVAADEEVLARTDLVPDPIAVPPSVPPPVPVVPIVGSENHSVRVWTGAGLIAAGAVAISTGVVWLAINGQGTCHPAPGGTCERNYDTSLQGWFALGAGAALAGAGVGLLLWHGHDEQVSLGLGQSSVFALGRF